jgi:hypothetical protein
MDSGEKRSTETAIHSLLESIHDSTGLENQTGIFGNLTKACDDINHEVLLAKLYSYGVRGTANLQCKSYLAHQKQDVGNKL